MSNNRLTFTGATRALFAIIAILFTTWAFAQYENLNKQNPKESFAARTTHVSSAPHKPNCNCNLASQPLFQANVTNHQLLSFASEATLSAFTYNYNDYRRHFQNTSSQFFTPQGWRQFVTKLRESGNLETVVNNKLLVKAQPTDAAIILSQGMDDGIYSWQIQLPIMLIYQGNGTQPTKQDLVVNIHVRRTGDIEGLNGIAIDSMVATPRKEKLI